MQFLRIYIIFGIRYFSKPIRKMYATFSTNCPSESHLFTLPLEIRSRPHFQRLLPRLEKSSQLLSEILGPIRSRESAFGLDWPRQKCQEAAVSLSLSISLPPSRQLSISGEEKAAEMARWRAPLEKSLEFLSGKLSPRCKSPDCERD